MEIILLRHGESQGNADGRMQGRRDAELTARGREQAESAGRWLGRTLGDWHATYASPLLRAWDTAGIVVRAARAPAPSAEADLMEIAAGDIEGLNEAEIRARFPEYFMRGVTELGDFARYGGESYEGVQARVARVRARLLAAHQASEQRVLLVGHGGFHFQLAKALLCEPVPRVCILKMGNCSASLVRMRVRRGTLIGELVWHVPVELMGGQASEGAAALFR